MFWIYRLSLLILDREHEWAGIRVGEEEITSAEQETIAGVKREKRKAIDIFLLGRSLQLSLCHTRLFVFSLTLDAAREIYRQS